MLSLFTKVAKELVKSHMDKGIERDKACENVARLVRLCTPSAMDFSENSVLATVRWHSAPLIQLLEQRSLPWQLYQAVVVFLERSSLYDWRLRLDYLEAVVNQAKPSCTEMSIVLSVFGGSLSNSFGSDLMEELRTCYQLLDNRCSGKLYIS